MHGETSKLKRNIFTPVTKTYTDTGYCI